MKEFGSRGEVRPSFRTRTITAGLLGGNEGCGIC